MCKETKKQDCSFPCSVLDFVWRAECHFLNFFPAPCQLLSGMQVKPRYFGFIHAITWLFCMVHHSPKWLPMDSHSVHHSALSLVATLRIKVDRRQDRHKTCGHHSRVLQGGVATRLPCSTQFSEVPCKTFWMQWTENVKELFLEVHRFPSAAYVKEITHSIRASR